MQTSNSTSPKIGNIDEAPYRAYLDRVQARFAAIAPTVPLFTTNAEGLYDAYLNSFADSAMRQHHTCHACRRFIEAVGGLVTIDPLPGIPQSAVWSLDDDGETAAIEAMLKIIRRAKITGVFLSADAVLGTPITGIWQHLSLTLPKARLHTSRTMTPFQAASAKREDYITVSRALADFTLDQLEQVVVLLKSDALYRSEKLLGQAEWLRDVKAQQFGVAGDRRNNVVWLAVATAPAGFCHPRSSMIGTLLDDIAAGYTFNDVAARFAKKMHPLAYQRPKAAPTAGAIAQAEKIVAQLGAAGSLARRFARLEDVVLHWAPTPVAPATPGEGVFSSLLTKGNARPSALYGSPQPITWKRFERDVLPTAQRMTVQAPTHGSYTSLLTAVNPEAPPILQWDTLAQRNPVSWYFWHGGAPASQFGLTAGAFYPVTGITLKPSMWYGNHTHQGVGVFFLLQGAAETRFGGSCLFPEILKSEFHPIRSVLEAFSQSATVEGRDQQSAAGLGFTFNDARHAAPTTVIRVWAGGAQHVDYTLDRWE